MAVTTSMHHLASLASTKSTKSECSSQPGGTQCPPALSTMLKHGIINPLNALDIRCVSFRPPHFTCTTLDGLWCDIRDIEDYIYRNLESRYCITSVTIGNQEHVEIGFEDHAEASIFGLVINQINRRPDLF